VVWPDLALRRLVIGVVALGIAALAVADARSATAAAAAAASLVGGSIFALWRVRQGAPTPSERAIAERNMRALGGVGGVVWIALAAVAAKLDPQSGVDIAGAMCAGVVGGFFLILGLGPLRDTKI
jgi:peptidoglycan/LPS O-acetylase OafA/YrhL